MEEKTKSKGYVLRKLFLHVCISAQFTFGGGYVIVTLLKENLWIIITGSKKMKCWIWLRSPSLHLERLQ